MNTDPVRVAAASLMVWDHLEAVAWTTKFIFVLLRLPRHAHRAKGQCARYVGHLRRVATTGETSRRPATAATSFQTPETPVIRVYMMVVLLGARISSHLESAPSSFLSPWASGTSARSPATVWCASSATFITAVVDAHPLVCRTLDVRVCELRRPGEGPEVVPEHG